MTDQPTDTTTTARPAGAGHAAAGTGMEHEQMTEVVVDWCGTPRETTTERPICRYCWHEVPNGNPRREDWPCPTVQAQAEVERLRALMAALSARVEDVLADRSWSASHQALVVEADAVAGLLSLLWRDGAAAPAAAPDSQQGGTAPADRGPL